MKKENVFIFLGIFVISLIFILFLVFNQNKKISENTGSWSLFSWSISRENKKEEILTLIEDKRNNEVDMTVFLENLKKQVPSISEFKLKKLDFSDSSVKEYLEKNSIKVLPAVIFSTDNFPDETWIKSYLTKLETWEYNLDIWAVYNPFLASDRWLSMIDKNIIDNLKKDSYFENWNDKKIIWLEYSDLACPYCQDFNNSWIIEEVLKDFDWQISKTYNHLRVHEWNHYEFLECLAKENSEKEFFSFIKKSFKSKISNTNDLLNEVEKSWLNKEKIENCLIEENFSEKVNFQTLRALENFWVKSTPTSVFINSETWEYKVVSGYTKDLWKEPYLKAIENLK